MSHTNVSFSCGFSSKVVERTPVDAIVSFAIELVAHNNHGRTPKNAHRTGWEDGLSALGLDFFDHRRGVVLGSVVFLAWSDSRTG